MARFYKSAEGEFLQDKMYQPPIELMAKVIGNADQQILNNETALASLYDKLNAQGLAVDNPRLQEIINGYKSQIDEMATKIQQNPLEFRRETGNIRNLGRDIQTNWGTGEVSAIQGNKAARDKFVSTYLERVKDKEGRVLQQDVTNAVNAFDKQYNSAGGANYKGPNQYNQYKTEDLNPYTDINEIAESVGKGWEADMVNEGYSNVAGQWIREGVNGKEIADENEIKQAIQTRLLSDPEVVGYYGQQLKFGAMSPEQLKTKIESAANVYAQKYGYVKKTSTVKTDVNPYSMEAVKNANDIDKMNRQHELNKKMKKYESDLESIKEIGTSAKSTFLTPDQMKAYNKEYDYQMTDLASSLGINPVNVKPKDIRAKLYELSYIANSTGNKEQIEAVKAAKERLVYAGSLYNKKEAEASWASGINYIGADATVAAKKDFENVLKDPRQLYGKKMYYKVNGKTYNTTMNDIYNNPVKFGLKTSTFETAPEEKMDIKDIYNQGSVRPLFQSSTNNKLNTMNFEFNVNGASIEANTDFNNIGITLGN